MKKILFLASLAAVAMTSCTSESNEYVGGNDNTPKEIALKAFATPTTRAALEGTALTDNQPMYVAAYQALPTPAGNYFGKTTFTGTTAAHWKGGKFWPLSEATLNFVAVTGAGLNAGDINIESDLSSTTVDYRSTATGAYSATSQVDIMYADAQAAVTKSANTLTFPVVNMTFKHAMSLIKFAVKGNSTTEITGGTGAITVNSIKLNGAKYNGYLTVTTTNSTASASVPSSTHAWSNIADIVNDVTVPNLTDYALASKDTYYSGAAGAQYSLLVIPGAIRSFDINYTVNGKQYTYRYFPQGSDADYAVAAGKKYVFQINFILHEIEIAPTVTDWTDPDPAIGVINVQ